MITYTPEQRAIIRHTGNAVVIAKPGSGKTETVAQVIRLRLPLLPEHRGVVAISYTNKASNELRTRSLRGALDKKCSFFGTIDRFFIAEIVLPFGRHVWGAPQEDVTVTKAAELPEEMRFDSGELDLEEDDLRSVLPQLGDLYRRGFILLEAVGFLACHLFSTSTACRRYILARYTDLIVDEYQDCGLWQHTFFELASQAGIRTIAVGDADQSIFHFSGKRAQYLRELGENPRYKTFFLTLNHRSHPSIAEYAARFISAGHQVPEDVEPKVFESNIRGSEIEIGEWLNGAIPRAAEYFNVRSRNQIAILVRSGRTAGLVRDSLTLPFKYFIGTVLDEDSSPAASIYREILQWIFDRQRARREFVDEHLPPESKGSVIRRAVTLLADLKNAAPELQLAGHIDDFRELAEIVTGRKASERSTERLLQVIASEESLQTFIPPYADEVQLMTIHKAKGLEFDVVFHLDLYKYIFPMYKAPPEEEEQDRNLHYVALTRARKACILCTSTVRHNKDGPRGADPSPFLFQNGVHRLRAPSPV